jgi:hypothetical protein
MWNLFGTAAVLPIYLYLHTSYTNAKEVSSVISTAQPQLIALVSILVAFIPPTYMFSAYTFDNEFTRHGAIAIYVFSPLLLGVLIALISSMDSEPHKNHRNSSKSVRYLYILAALTSGFIHIYTMMVTCLSGDESVQFGNVFIPSLTSVRSGSVDNIYAGAYLFLKNDWIVVNMTCTTWVYLMVDSNQVVVDVQGSATRILLIIASTLLLGPGATVSSALYLRENNLLARHKQTTKS